MNTVSGERLSALAGNEGGESVPCREGGVELIARLEAAPGPDRELDILISRAGYKHALIRWELMTTDTDGSDCPDGVLIWTTERERPFHHNIDRYTSSLDAAVSLVPEGMSFKIIGSGVMKAQAAVFDGTREGWHASARDGHPAIALCIAALKARAPSPTATPTPSVSTDPATGGNVQDTSGTSRPPETGE